MPARLWLENEAWDEPRNLYGIARGRSGSKIEKEAWEEQEEYVAQYVDWAFKRSLLEEEKGAILLAGLAGAKPIGRKATQLDWSETRHQDAQLALKRKLLGVENKYPELKLPHKKAGPAAPVLRSGSPEEAEMKPDSESRIREVCRDWAMEGGEPCTVLVARHGVIVIHEAFGGPKELPIDINTHLPLASIAKSFSGLLFAQFMDQGLLAVDDPVGKYLPDFPTDGEKAITLRHCLTHTTGFKGNGSQWGGMNNPWLDNVIAHGLEYCKPGKVRIYNGMGFDLAGKAMEIVSGKSIFRLFHENFFNPLGLHNPTITNMGMGVICTVEDLARVGQLMANRGSYGETEFFSPATFEQLLPRPLAQMFPGIKTDEGRTYGLGINWLGIDHPKADEEGVPVLSKNTIGHKAGSSAVLRVDLDNDLVIAVSRFKKGKDYWEHLARFLLTVAACME
ncbi:serine hydrolase domain-containing protein [Candidatus Hydrogenedentota bacterium]